MTNAAVTATKTVAHRRPQHHVLAWSCHMPQVTVSPQLSFTNHWIGSTPRAAIWCLPVPSKRMRRGCRTFRIRASSRSISLRPLLSKSWRKKERIGPNHRMWRVVRQISDALFTGTVAQTVSQRQSADAEAPLRRALAMTKPCCSGDAGRPAVLAEVLFQSGRNEEAFGLLQIAAKDADAKVASQSFREPCATRSSPRRKNTIEELWMRKTASEKDPRHTAILLNDLR